MKCLLHSQPSTEVFIVTHNIPITRSLAPQPHSGAAGNFHGSLLPLKGPGTVSEGPLTVCHPQFFHLASLAPLSAKCTPLGTSARAPLMCRWHWAACSPGVPFTRLLQVLTDFSPAMFVLRIKVSEGACNSQNHLFLCWQPALHLLFYFPKPLTIPFQTRPSV